jgi:phage antirepressor YoqD-like protein
MNLQVFNYQNSPITFSQDGEVMVNATQMAKPFGKLPANFLQTQQTKDFIQVLENRYCDSNTEILKVINGTSNPGTWMHQKLALKYAGWLSPEFELWVYDRIEELLTTGKTELQPLSKAEMTLQVIAFLQEETQTLKSQKLLLEQSIQQQAPKVAYYNEVLQTNGGQVASVIAQDFGMSATAFNRKLKEHSVIRKVGGTWVLCAKHQNKDYVITKTHTFLDSKGDKQTAIQMLWTQKGREFLHSLLNAA